jgi:uncharacterized protein (TIGR02246 family)
MNNKFFSLILNLPGRQGNKATGREGISLPWRHIAKPPHRPVAPSPCRLVFLCISLCLSIPVANVVAQEGRVKQAGKEKPKSAAAEIRAVLDAQVAAWNAGNLEEFMDGYWRSPDLTFFSAGRKLSGWDATIERYRKTYQAEGREMGKLAFSDLDIQLLGSAAAVVRGRWELTMSDGKKPGGLYTLIFRRFKEGWKIIHDHTSSN